MLLLSVRCRWCGLAADGGLRVCSDDRDFYVFDVLEGGEGVGVPI